MPIYEYHCPQCGHRFERLVGVSEADAQACAACGAPTRRLVSTFAVGRTAATARAGTVEPCGPGCCRLQGAHVH
ncbi:MAG: zinc ribbon domain-containing protein [Armatimonadota bacterium]|nr:zinc ribbon domain-containing protein [Armatimonadota bacterium]